MTPKDQRQRIDLVVHGLSGFAEQECVGWGFHGHFVSHTGYHHVTDELEVDEVAAEAEALYQSQAALCFLVGDEHREFGWKTLDTELNGAPRIRIPDWSGTAMREALKHCGTFQSCPLNEYWVFAEGITQTQAKEVLKPLLAKATRFSDQEQLARMLIDRYPATELGYLSRQQVLF